VGHFLSLPGPSADRIEEATVAEVMVPGLERILAAYEHGLQKLADEMIAELDPSDQEKMQLLLASQLAQAVVRTYDSFQLERGPALDASTSVMYATTTQPSRKVLNVPLRTLVDNNTLTGVEARLLASLLNLKRSIIISGASNVGKSTLLNALIGILPRDHRLVCVTDSGEELPAVQERSFTVQLTAKRGTPARANAFRKAEDMKPTWLIAGELLRRDGQAFFEACGTGISGLATVETPDPEMALMDWISMTREMAEHLGILKPIFAHMDRDQGGRPRVQRIVETNIEGGKPSVSRYWGT
jgi:type IV secretory pathway ATPase VirB11/archaellum biosynthesis ATPase